MDVSAAACPMQLRFPGSKLQIRNNERYRNLNRVTKATVQGARVVTYGKSEHFVLIHDISR